MTGPAAVGDDRGWRPVALLVAGAFFMENLDGTILTSALPRMAASLHVPAVTLSVAITAYLVTLGVLIPVSGWVADRAGARTVFAAAITVFTLASGLCALSDGAVQLTVFRVLQGVGGAMMVPVGRLVVLRRTAKADLIEAIAYLTWPALVAPVLAPALGGLLATYASWRWIFVINLPLGAIALVCALRLVPNVRETERRPLDLGGFVLVGAALALLVTGAQAVTADQINWTEVSVALAVGTVVLAMAVRHLWRAPAPLIRLTITRIDTFRVALSGGTLFRFAIGGAPFLLSLAFQDGLGWSPVRSGLVVIALFVGNLGIKPATTPILRRWPFRTVLAGSAGAAAVTLFACTAFGQGNPLVLIVVVLVASGAFRSIGFTAYNTIVFADVPQDEMNDANTLITTAQQLTIGLGVAVSAVAVRIGTPVNHALGGHAGGWGPYAVAFVVIGCLPLGAMAEARRLRVDAGASLAVRQPRAAAD